MSNRVGIFLDAAQHAVVVTALRGHRSWLGGKGAQGGAQAPRWWAEVQVVDAVLDELERVAEALPVPADDGSDLA